MFLLASQLLVWEALTLAGLLGWGVGVLRLLRLQKLDLGTALCTGTAAWLALGGWLNLLGVAARPVLWFLPLAGCVWLAFCWRSLNLAARLHAAWLDIWPRSRTGRVVFWILAAFLTICCLSHLAETTWNRFDDTQGYLAFTEKALALGGLHPEPFSLRRVESGVGGNIFLNEVTLAGPHTVLGMDFADGFVGFLAFAGLLLTLARRFGTRRGWLLPVLFWLGASPFGRVNTTPVYLPLAMLLAVFALVLEADEASLTLGWPAAVLAGLLLGGAFSLKSTNLPISVAWLGLLALVCAVRSRRLAAAGALAGAGLVGMFVLLPWAVRHRLDEGTALFPSLGKGYHLTAYPGFPAVPTLTPLTVSLAVTLTWFALPLLALLCALPLLRGRSFLLRSAVLCFLAAASITAPLLSYALASEGIYRYLLPVENLSALLLLMVTVAAFRDALPATLSRALDRALQEQNPQSPVRAALAAQEGSQELRAPRRPPRAAAFYASGAVLTGWLVLAVHAAVEQGFYREPAQAAMLLLPGLGKDLTQPYETFLPSSALAVNTARVQHAQAVVPPGASIYESVEAAYGFDWRRNPVLLADYPGMASPPPGMPLDGTPEALRRYLLGKGIAYVMVDRTLLEKVDYEGFRRAPQVTTGVGDVISPWNDPVVGGYARMEWTVSNRTREMLFALAAPGRVLYDDGRLVVIKL